LTGHAYTAIAHAALLLWLLWLLLLLLLFLVLFEARETEEEAKDCLQVSLLDVCKSRNSNEMN